MPPDGKAPHGYRRLAESLGLERYQAAFLENDVSSALLPNLTADDLRELGVTSVAIVAQMLDAIAACASELDRPSHGSR